FLGRRSRRTDRRRSLVKTGGARARRARGRLRPRYFRLRWRTGHPRSGRRLSRRFGRSKGRLRGWLLRADQFARSTVGSSCFPVFGGVRSSTAGAKDAEASPLTL